MSVAVQADPALTTTQPREPTTKQEYQMGTAYRPFERLHVFEFNPNPRTRTWERLECIRLKKLGLSNNYSRHFNVTRSYNKPSTQDRPPQLPERSCDLSQFHKPRGFNGSFAPFHSQGKPTCGYFFSRETDNKKKRIGIPAANLVKWRSLNTEELH